MYEGRRRSRSFFHRISVAGKKEENCSGRNRLQHSSIFSFSFFSVVTLVSKRGRRLPYKTNICRDYVHAMHYSAPSLVQRVHNPVPRPSFFVSFHVCSTPPSRPFFKVSSIQRPGSLTGWEAYVVCNLSPSRQLTSQA